MRLVLALVLVCAFFAQSSGDALAANIGGPNGSGLKGLIATTLASTLAATVAPVRTWAANSWLIA